MKKLFCGLLSFGVCLFSSVVSFAMTPEELSEFRAHLHNTAIYGRDDRFVMPSGVHWNMIGKVKTSKTFCTGTLVSACLVLTAAHCIKDNNLHNVSFIGSNGGPSSGVKDAISPRVDTNKNMDKDWEILVLKERLGDRLGWMGVRFWAGPSSVSVSNFILAGYAADVKRGEVATADINVTIHKTLADNTIYHDASSFMGDSGAPIFGLYSGSPYIVAIGTRSDPIHVPKYEDSVASIGVGSANFLSEIIKAAGKYCP